MSQRAKRKRTVTVSEDSEVVFSRRKKETENVEHKLTFKVLLPNASCVTLTLDNPDEEMSVANFIRAVMRKYDNTDPQKGSRTIQWSNAFLEDTMGNKIKDGKIISLAAVNKTANIVLQDGGIDTVHAHQDLWDVTPEPHLLGALPQDYSMETALADLIDNSLQAVWANAAGERRLISVKIGKREISIFDSGQGMDGSKEHSIAKWGTMGGSSHRDKRREAVGGRPPYLKPFFGMYGCGGVAASMFLGSVVMVSSKTKTSKKVVTLRLEKDSLVQRTKSDRIWRTPGEIRELSQEERKMSPHGSFTKVHISSLKAQYWNDEQLKCMLKDIYFPYIQNDGSDEAIQTVTPVEFEVNGTNLIEVEGGEVVATNLAACNAPPFIVGLHCRLETDMKAVPVVEANAKLSCLYFPIIQGKESLDAILERLESEEHGLGENFETFCRVSIRNLGRLLPDARWGRLPFMEPKRRRTENTQIPHQCYKRVKCSVDTDAGFVPTNSKTDLAHKNPLTVALKNLGRKYDAGSPTVHMDIERDGKILSLNQLDKEYQEWLKAMHESFDEEVECCGTQATLILNPTNGRELGISHNVMRVLTEIRRKGQLWKASQRLKITKVPPAGKDFYATLEYILCEGLEGDPGDARMICRPMEYPEEMGSKLVLNMGVPSFELGISKSFPLELISSGKCLAVDDEIWTKQLEKKRLKSPACIDILKTEQVQRFDVDKGFPKGETVEAGFYLPKEIIAVVRPYSYTADNKEKILDSTDQKYIVKDSREMRMDIKEMRGNGSPTENASGHDVKYTAQTRASLRKGVHGLYCFSMEGSRLLEMFTKVGRYTFTFSLVNGTDANPLCTEVDLYVEASEKIGHWKLRNQLSESEGAEFKRLEGRLGSEIGPIYISCYDIYSNQISFRSYPKIQIQVRKNGKPVGIEIENASGSITQDKMHMQVKVLLGGNLDKLRPSFEASLRVGVKEPCYAEMPITVLPGDLSKVEILSKQELDNCLHPGDVIHDFELQAMDTYGNAVEKGQRVKVELVGLEFQDQNDLYRKVNDQGCLNFGGLLKVVGNYGTEGYIRVSSENKILLDKHFQLLIRELKVLSGVPEEGFAGSTIENLVFGIFDDKGQIDEGMSGRQHSLMIDLSPQDGVQYPFRKGICTIPKLSFPAETGILQFSAFHSFHPELCVHLKIKLLQCPSLAMVMLPEQGFDDGAVYQALDEPVKSDPCSSDEVNIDSKIRSTGISLLNNLMKWEEDLKQRGAKIGQYEAKLSGLQNSLADVEGEIRKLHTGSIGDGKIISKQGSCSGSVEQTINEIRRQGNSAAAAWVELVSDHRVELYEPRVFSEVIGVVALLGKVENDLLSRAVSEYLGKENMLAIVCKSYKGVEQLETHDFTGKLVPLSGIHGIANLQKRHIDGRFRVICLEDVRCYKGDIKSDEPQKQLVIEDPKLPSGSIPAGFIGYAVNLIELDPENQYSLATQGVGLRETLFFNLLSYVQVYQTKSHMMQAVCCIQDGAISLDGGIVRQKGIFECGNREEVSVRFPTTISKEISLCECPFWVEEKLIQKKEEKEKLEDEIKRTKTALQKSKRKFSEKQKEFRQLQTQYRSLSSLLQPDAFELGSSSAPSSPGFAGKHPDEFRKGI